jgi:pimeloyl-ACP methyl ester carboxylesterase
VGWSSGSNFALGLGVLHPELVRSLFLYEPALGSIITDPKDLEVFNKEGESFGPVFTAAQEGDLQKSTRLLIDWVNDQPGTFAALPAWRRNVILDNSRSWGPNLMGGPDIPITCDQLGQIKAPVTVAKGQQTRPNFAIVSDATHECIPGSQLVAIPNTRHLAPGENPSAFNEAVLNHLKGN